MSSNSPSSISGSIYIPGYTTVGEPYSNIEPNPLRAKRIDPPEEDENYFQGPLHKRRTFSKQTQPLVKGSITLISPYKSTYSATTHIQPELMDCYLKIQDAACKIPLAGVKPLTNDELVKNLLKEQTSYSLAKKHFSTLSESALSIDSRKVALQEIYMKASIELHATSGAPKFFLYDGPNHLNLNFIAYRRCSESDSRISVFHWSGGTKKSEIPPDSFLGRGLFSIAQSIYEISSGEFFALKSLRTYITPEESQDCIDGIGREIGLLSQIEWKYGKIRGLQRAPILSLPPQTTPLNHRVLYGAHIQEQYDGNLHELNFDHLSSANKLLFLKEFANIIDVVKFLNCAVDFDNSGLVHGDIKPENILFESKNGKIRLCLSDFGLAYRHDDLVKLFDSYTKTPERFPVLYSEDCFLLSDKALIKNCLLQGDVINALKIIKAMEIYALGKTLEKVLYKICALSTENLLIASIQENFHFNFYFSLHQLIQIMQNPDPLKRPDFDRAQQLLVDAIELPHPSMSSLSG